MVRFTRLLLGGGVIAAPLFVALWAGQAFRLSIEMTTAELTRHLADAGLAKLLHR